MNISRRNDRNGSRQTNRHGNVQPLELHPDHQDNGRVTTLMTPFREGHCAAGFPMYRHTDVEEYFGFNAAKTRVAARLNHKQDQTTSRLNLKTDDGSVRPSISHTDGPLRLSMSRMSRQRTTPPSRPTRPRHSHTSPPNPVPNLTVNRHLLNSGITDSYVELRRTRCPDRVRTDENNRHSRLCDPALDNSKQSCKSVPCSANETDIPFGSHYYSTPIVYSSGIALHIISQIVGGHIF